MAIEAQMYSENLGFALKGELFMENGRGFLDPPQMSTTLSDHHQQYLNHLPDNNSSSQLLPKHALKDQQSTLFSHNFSAHIEKQRMEIDQFIRLQNERLRLTLQEQKKQHTAFIINKYESRTKLLLNQKEEQIAEASNRTFQLENLLTGMEIENQKWQKVAKEKEAMVASLNSTIQRLKEAANPPNGVDDAESCCENIDGEKTEYGESGNMKKMVCRCCNNRNSCVIILPCRHLCSCKDCEVFLYSCPVCRNVKRATIEVFI